MSNPKYLCVVSDDWGMHPAINEGIVQAFVDGLLTDSNLMPPCPAFEEAAQLARQHQVPVGLHATFTCDWDIYRWGPLTELSSMRAPDGGLKQLVEEAWLQADEAEAANEIRAQYAAIQSRGIHMTHVGEHMGFDSGGKFMRVMTQLAWAHNLPHKGESTLKGAPLPRYKLDGGFSTSAHSTDLAATKIYLRQELEGLPPGYNIWLVHPALDHPSLEAMCSPNHPSFHWARTYRAIDQSLLLDPEVRDWLDQLGIQRVPLSACPITRVVSEYVPHQVEGM